MTVILKDTWCCRAFPTGIPTIPVGAIKYHKNRFASKGKERWLMTINTTNEMWGRSIRGAHAPLLPSPQLLHWQWDTGLQPGNSKGSGVELWPPPPTHTYIHCLWLPLCTILARPKDQVHRDFRKCLAKNLSCG